MDIQITEQERAQNVAFQIKQLLIAINRLKPEVASALQILQAGADGISIESLKTALGANVDDIIKQLETFKEVLL